MDRSSRSCRRRTRRRPARWSWWAWSRRFASWTGAAWPPARATVARSCGRVGCPGAHPAELVRELYERENRGKPEPSGSQDMIGLIYPGVNRLDFDFTASRAASSRRTSNRNTRPAGRPLAGAGDPHGPRGAAAGRLQPAGHQEPRSQSGLRRLGQTGQGLLTSAILAARSVARTAAHRDERVHAGAGRTLLPHTVRHPTVTADLLGLLQYYQSNYAGAMYSGCGGGYLYVVSAQPVPGAFRVSVRTA